MNQIQTEKETIFLNLEENYLFDIWGIFDDIKDITNFYAENCYNKVFIYIIGQ